MTTDTIDELRKQLEECNRLREAEGRQTAECIERMREAQKQAEEARVRVLVIQREFKEMAKAAGIYQEPDAIKLIERIRLLRSKADIG